jgi:hypothetical protein
MVPRAKLNIHECDYHLNRMKYSVSVEEMEINFAAFVNSSRNVTFVLQKEFANDPIFKTWYSRKQEEMSTDQLSQFFLNLRNKIVKEGINDLMFTLQIHNFNSLTDVEDKPDNSVMVITNKGIYWFIDGGTGKEDYLPAKTKGSIGHAVSLLNHPVSHLGSDISSLGLFELCNIYLTYLKNLVEEWTGIKNTA